LSYECILYYLYFITPLNVSPSGIGVSIGFLSFLQF